MMGHMGKPGYKTREKTIGSPASCKNCLTVGSVNSHTELYVYTKNRQLQYVSSFSSIGPSEYNRIKPDLCAPGSNIKSASALTECDITYKSGT